MSKTKISRAIISIKARVGLFRIKNDGVQRIFKTACIIKYVYPKTFDLLVLVTVKRSRAVKIVIYKNIHAGANTHGGGVSAGFVSVVYQAIFEQQKISTDPEK